MIDEELLRSLLREQHPDLAGLDLRRMEGGWDNEMWRLGDDLAIRMPRTDRAPALLEKEHRWMPELAPRLPLPVPVPVRLGEPADRFPATWIVTTWVHGEPADLAAVDRGPHAAETLAGFLAALHQEAPADAPTNPDHGVALRRLADGFERGLQSMDANDRTGGMRAIWEDAIAAPEWTRPPVWLHGDLHPANVVVADGTLTGVIDFGELCAGDPALDLAAAWVLLPKDAAARFFERYETDAATVRRARGRALLKCFALIAIGRAGEEGRAGGKPTWKPAGEAALDRLLAASV